MFAENIVHFARVLRSAGMPVGPDRVIAALEAIEEVGFSTATTCMPRCRR